MAILGKRWTGLIVEVLLNGAARFSEIAQAIPSVSDRMLAERLRELEAEGIVIRRVFPEIPVRIVYELSDKGKDLAPVLAAVHQWADRWIIPPAPEPSVSAEGR